MVRLRPRACKGGCHAHYKARHPHPPAGSSYFTVHNNFAVYGGCAAKNDFEGHDGHHYSNVYAFMGMGLDNGAWEGRGEALSLHGAPPCAHNSRCCCSFRCLDNGAPASPFPARRLRRQYRPQPGWPRGPVLRELHRSEPGRRLRQARETPPSPPCCMRELLPLTPAPPRRRSAPAAARLSSRTTLSGRPQATSPSAGRAWRRGRLRAATLAPLPRPTRPRPLSSTTRSSSWASLCRCERRRFSSVEGYAGF